MAQKSQTALNTFELIVKLAGNNEAIVSIKKDIDALETYLTENVEFHKKQTNSKGLGYAENALKCFLVIKQLIETPYPSFSLMQDCFKAKESLKNQLISNRDHYNRPREKTQKSQS